MRPEMRGQETMRELLAMDGPSPHDNHDDDEDKEEKTTNDPHGFLAWSLTGDSAVLSRLPETAFHAGSRIDSTF